MNSTGLQRKLSSRDSSQRTRPSKRSWRQLSKGAIQAAAQLNELQKTFEIERTAWTNDKKTLEETIIDLSTSEKHSESDRTSREQEVRLQEERAKVYLLVPIIFSRTYFPQRLLRSAIQMSWLHMPNLGRLSKL
ncbi:uncharacterized protein EV420DRAFT_1034635 [Desarmillaria tabescens]|uniref:Uncharacterized protein n=1 Tax=Armillaria tabescens TaxID=1929756 RepID=A0AA39NEN4_ARMTA|nr:uncharacterized protein EV420DRAFT_1034635 [Desarmillaria tabescens]KAK0464253.1 hypothetical protein EV420DRAFT_1034635 [Desarmillaria tabescens]